MSNIRLSQHFSFDELTDSEKHPELVAANREEASKEPILSNLKRLCLTVLQPIRDELGKSIYVNSGYRSIALNKAVGGSKTSDHRKGLAADITIHSFDGNRQLFNLIIKLIESGKIEVKQLIFETPPNSNSWIHISAPIPGGKKNEVLLFDGKKYTPVVIKR